jgi:hypothetical protein
MQRVLWVLSVLKLFCHILETVLKFDDCRFSNKTLSACMEKSYWNSPALFNFQRVSVFAQSFFI